MVRKLLSRMHDRFFDRADDAFSIDSARIDWIREHEPHRLRPVFGATNRNARRILQLGLIAVVWSIWWIVRGIWMPGDSDPQRWFTAGLLLGAGGVTVGVSRLLAYLAYLKGDADDPPQSEREEAPAR